MDLEFHNLTTFKSITLYSFHASTFSQYFLKPKLADFNNVPLGLLNFMIEKNANRGKNTSLMKELRSKNRLETDALFFCIKKRTTYNERQRVEAKIRRRVKIKLTLF